MNLWVVLAAYALILLAQFLPLRWWWLSLLLFVVGLGLIFWQSCDVQTPVHAATAPPPPLSPLAVGEWFRRAAERARAVLAPAHAEAAARFILQTDMTLRELGLWLDTGGKPSADVVTATQQAANAAAALAAKCRQKGGAGNRAKQPELTTPATTNAPQRPAKAGRTSAAPTTATSRTAPEEDLADRIRAAWKRAGGDAQTYVRLAPLRRELPHEPRDAIDAELRAMQQRGEAVLYPIDAPQRLRPEDDAAFLRVAGERRDLVHLRPKRSDEAIVLDAVQAEAANHKPGTLLVMADVRRRAPLNKQRFDRAALELSRARRVTIHHHDHPHLVSDADREGMVHDAARDVYYVGIVAR